jgi:hypothetical protein
MFPDRPSTWPSWLPIPSPHDVDPPADNPYNDPNYSPYPNRAPVVVTSNSRPDLRSWLIALINNRQSRVSDEPVVDAGNARLNDVNEALGAHRLLGLVGGKPMKFRSIQPPIHFPD